MTNERADFEQMVGECFSDGVCPPVPFDNASAHECFEAVQLVLGPDCSSERFRELTASDQHDLALGFGSYFECEPPTTQQITAAVFSILARIPADDNASLGGQQ